VVLPAPQLVLPTPTCSIRFAFFAAIFSGGAIIRRIVKNTLGLDGAVGLSIFDAPQGWARSEVKSHIKNAINEMDLDRDTKNEIISEKINIFRRNDDIVRAIQPGPSSFKRIAKFFVVILFVIVLFICFILRWKA